MPFLLLISIVRLFRGSVCPVPDVVVTRNAAVRSDEAAIISSRFSPDQTAKHLLIEFQARIPESIAAVVEHCGFSYRIDAEKPFSGQSSSCLKIAQKSDSSGPRGQCKAELLPPPASDYALLMFDRMRGNAHRFSCGPPRRK